MPRWLHKAWAKFWGYYWLPCPICGKYTGGHEIKEIVSVYMPDEKTQRQICRSQLCAYEAGVMDAQRKLPVILRYKHSFNPDVRQ